MVTPQTNEKQKTAPRLEPRGLATGIGSLPHLTPIGAMNAVLQYLPRCPFWPQLPRRSHLEGMTLQYVEGFPALRERTDGGDPQVDTGESGQAELAAFYERVLAEGTEPFALSEERAPGFYAFEETLVQYSAEGMAFVKGHVTGPVTLASSLKDLQGREVTHDEAFREAVALLTARKAVWQIERLARFGVPVIVFLDEPVMEVYGSAYSTLNRELVAALWQPVLSAVAEAGALSGIHCCGNTDWGLLFESGTDIVNFDSCHYLEKMLLYPEAAEAFLRRGGALAWGAVPTADEAWERDADGLLTDLERGVGRFVDAGLDEGLVRRQSMITPSCGMGGLSEDLAVHILSMLQQVSARFEG